jgi:hypothetical protein
MIKNLSQLKKALKANPRLEITGHCQSDYVGQVRRVTLANSVGFYSVMDGQPDHKISRANQGRGSVLYWSNAPFWTFRDGVCSLFSHEDHTQEHLIMAFRVLDDAT